MGTMSPLAVRALAMFGLAHKMRFFSVLQYLHRRVAECAKGCDRTGMKGHGTVRWRRYGTMPPLMVRALAIFVQRTQHSKCCFFQPAIVSSPSPCDDDNDDDDHGGRGGGRAGSGSQVVISLGITAH